MEFKDSAHRWSRRKLLASAGFAGSAVLSGCEPSSDTASLISTVAPPPPPPPPPPASGSGNHPIFGADPMTRQNQALTQRTLAASFQASTFYGTQETNGDEGRFADYRASYSKALPHNELGEVDIGAYQAYLSALDSGRNRDFEAIPLGGSRKLISPQAAFKLEMVGLDSHRTFMRPAPAFDGLETSAEMGELYWKALCRDIPFTDYETNSLLQSAITDLNQFSQTVGPKEFDLVTASTVFRGETPGDLVGPYLSQFLWQDIPYGHSTITQSYLTPAAGDDHMIDTASWLGVQNGVAAPALEKNDRRYINDARALGEYVHLDYSYQAYIHAALIMLAIPDSFDIGNLYRTSATQAAFTSLGGPDVLDLVCKAGNLSLTGAWYQKWLVHRRARPEVYAARLHYQLSGQKDYLLPGEIGESDGVARIFSSNGTYLLPQAFPEGSPTHPSYPAGHATIAGACSTVLKAFFNENLEYPNPVISNSSGSELSPYSGQTLTLGGEINKLANNIALGRDWAGVHYRSDGVDGLLVGEQQAIGLLQDYSRTYNEDFDGFNLTLFDGTAVQIINGTIL